MKTRALTALCLDRGARHASRQYIVVATQEASAPASNVTALVIEGASQSLPAFGSDLSASVTDHVLTIRGGAVATTFAGKERTVGSLSPSSLLATLSRPCC